MLLFSCYFCVCACAYVQPHFIFCISISIPAITTSFCHTFLCAVSACSQGKVHPSIILCPYERPSLPYHVKWNYVSSSHTSFFSSCLSSPHLSPSASSSSPCSPMLYSLTPHPALFPTTFSHHSSFLIFPSVPLGLPPAFHPISLLHCLGPACTSTLYI